MAKRCCAKMCYNAQTTNKNVYYFGFPKNEYLWVEIIELSESVLVEVEFTDLKDEGLPC